MTTLDDAMAHQLVWHAVHGAVGMVDDGQGGQVLIPEAEFQATAFEMVRELSVDMSASAIEAVINAAADDVYRFGPLSGMMADENVTDIVVNAPGEIFVDDGSGLRPAGVAFRSHGHLRAFSTKHLARVGKSVNIVRPTADAQLSDGSRLHVVAAPIVEQGPLLAIRKFKASMDLATLVASGMLSESDAEGLRTIVAQRRNVMVVGGPGAGKTTLLGALLSEVDPSHRIVGVEDVPELRPHHPHYVGLLTRQSTVSNVANTTARDLVREALRMRPDRLIIGEVRGDEAFDMVSAMSTGMDGSMTTLHAPSVERALDRLGALLQMATGSETAARFGRDVIDVVIVVRRGDDGRRLIETVEQRR